MRQKRSRAFSFAKEHREKKMQIFQTDFRDAMASRFRMERSQRQLKKARDICQELDIAQNLTEPNHQDFWPPDQVTAQVLDHAEVVKRQILRLELQPDSYHQHKEHTDEEQTSIRQAESDPLLNLEDDDPDELCEITAVQYGTRDIDVSVSLFFS